MVTHNVRHPSYPLLQMIMIRTTFKSMKKSLHKNILKAILIDIYLLNSRIYCIYYV